MKTNPNELINVVTDTTIQHQLIDGSCGLTKREYFAAMAMQGILSRPTDEDEKIVAGAAVIIADALIEELNK